MSTTRCIHIRLNFSFDAVRNETWVKGLECFEALLSVEVLLDLDIVVEESNLKDFMINLLPFAALRCENITFRGPSYVQESTKREVEATWLEALKVEQTIVGAKALCAHLISQNLANYFLRL